MNLALTDHHVVHICRWSVW